MSQASPSSPGAQPAKDMRRNAREIFEYALAECSIRNALAKKLRYDSGLLWVGDERYPLDDFGHTGVISIGKAGHSMAEALTTMVPNQFAGIISCPNAPESPLHGFRYWYGGHPLPNEDSLRAGDAILEFLHALPERSLVMFLISGGASAIAEKPFSNTLTLSDVIQTYRALVHSGAPIVEINAIRKHLSAIKGGRMAQAAAGATQVSVLVSDVPDNALDALASGPTMPDSSTVADCHAIAQRYDMLPRFPESVRHMFEASQLRETPKAGDLAFAKSHFETLLSNQTAVNAAAQRATESGFKVEVDNRCDDWDFARAADYLLERLRRLRDGSPVCLISGGEVTVTVGERSGMGGRNQQFALYCAHKIAGESITVLSAGTDGVDGNSPAAGAVVDGTTWARATQRGLDPAAALTGFDAFPLLQPIGEAIIVGPTGNNVRDLRLLLVY